MASKSGSTQALLLSAIRYFGLASENGLPTRELEGLVKAEGKERQEAWRSILERSYPNLFKLDLQRATTQQIAESLAKEGLSSQDTIRKALNFFSLAVKDAGLRLSPHIKPYAGHRKLGRPARPLIEAQNKPLVPSTSFRTTEVDGTNEWQMLLSKFPDFDPSWPDDLRKNWLEGFERLSIICKNNKTGASNNQV